MFTLHHFHVDFAEHIPISVIDADRVKHILRERSQWEKNQTVAVKRYCKHRRCSHTFFVITIFRYSLQQQQQEALRLLTLRQNNSFVALKTQSDINVIAESE